MKKPLSLFSITLLLLSIALPSWGRTLELSTQDGVTLHANMSGRGANAVLLIHGRDKSSVVWKLFAEKLAAKGMRVLTIDLRGHGGSGKAPQSGDAAYPMMIEDVRSGLKTLQRYELKSLSIVGADVGANLALQAAAENDAVSNLVLLSPGFNIKGIKATQYLEGYGNRPLFLAAGTGDDYSAKTVKYMKTKAKGQSKLTVPNGGETGAQLLEEHPDLEDSVLQWLSGNYGNEVLEETNRTISIDAVDKMESTGKSFGE